MLTKRLYIAPLYLVFAGMEAASGQTLAVTGRVFDNGSGAPVAGAAVTVRAKDQSEVSSTADADGRFSLLLPKTTQVALRAMADGYIEMPTDGSPLRTIFLEVTPESTSVRADIPLTKAANIVGIVTDDLSDRPLQNVQISALRTTYKFGKPLLLGVGSTVTTGPAGRFTVGPVPPGNYVLRVDADPAPRVEAVSDRIREIRSSAPGYGRTLYPFGASATNPGSSTFSVMPGADIDVGVVRLVKRQLSTVLLNFGAGNCETASVGVRVSTKYGFATNRLVEKDVPCGSQALISNLSIGEYYFEASTKLNGSVAKYGAERVSVQTDLLLPLALHAPVEVAGTIRLSHTEAKSDTASVFRTVKVLFTPTERASFMSQRPSNVTDDGRFRSLLFLNEAYDMSISGLPNSIYLSMVTYNGSDVGNGTELQVSPGANSHDLSVLLSSETASLIGKVSLRSRGTACTRCVVAVVAAGKDPSRRIRGMTTREVSLDGGGSAIFSTLQPGKYTVFALDASRLGSLHEPGVLEKAEAKGLTVAVGQGQRLVVSEVPFVQ